MPQYHMPISNDGDDLTARERFDALPDMVQGYIECALFCGVEYPSDHPDADHDKQDDAPFNEIAIETVEKMTADCAKFEAEMTAVGIIPLVFESGDYDAKQCGRDLWYTRNGHGVGFTDRDQLDDGHARMLEGRDRFDGGKLSGAKGMGEYDLYRGDDGLIYGAKG